VIAKHGLENVRPGDVFISNDTYAGAGTHLNDMGLVSPVYFEDELVAFVAVNAHWTDVGGKDPGSMTPSATEIFQEGFQMPTVKLFDQGEARQDLFDIIEANCRFPDMSMGDLWASIAALRVGERRMRDLLERYGKGDVLQAMDELFAYCEKMMRRELARLPKGEFAAEDVIDQDGLGNGPFPVKVKVNISDDEFVIDFTGSSPQTPGPINVSRLALNSAARCAFHAITNPQVPANAGAFRPLRVVCPQGTVFSAQRPAPVSTYYEGMAHAVELVWKALAPHVEHRLTAGHMISTCVTIIAGLHPSSHDFFVYVETLPGGWGAGHDKDGVDGTGCVANGETYNIPVEVKETKFGFRVRQYAFNDEDGGAGKYRGGKGMVLDYEITSDFATLTGIFGRHLTPPWGLEGGGAGTCNRVQIIRRDGSEETHGRIAGVGLRKGDVVRLITGTAGGYGDPGERDRAQLLADIKDGYITPQQAMEIYRLDKGG
jgi:N-methylhydantoinase B